MAERIVPNRRAHLKAEHMSHHLTPDRLTLAMK